MDPYRGTGVWTMSGLIALVLLNLIFVDRPAQAEAFSACRALVAFLLSSFFPSSLVLCVAAAYRVPKLITYRKTKK